MTTLYHPDLPKGQNEVEVPDNEGTIAVLKKSGWQKTKPSSSDKGKASEQGGK